MEENYNQQSPLRNPASKPAQAPAPKHKLNKANIVMAILLVLALAAAVTFAILWATKKTDVPAASNNAEVSQTTAEPEADPQPKDEPSTAEQTSGDVLPIAETEKLLEKYIGEGNATAAYPLNAFYNTFASDFDDQQKLLLTYAATRGEEEDTACTEERYGQCLCTGKSISYDLMSGKYKALFGDYGSIEKKNYSYYNFIHLVYDDSINAYREYIFPGGGTTSLAAVHKVVSVERSGDDMIALLTFAVLNTDVEIPSGVSGPTTYSGLLNDTLNKMADSMAIYEFTLSPYNDSYILTAVKKI